MTSTALRHDQRFSPAVLDGGPAVSAMPLVMIVGLARSGTTWLGKIFDSHPETLYRHEPDKAERLGGDVPFIVSGKEAIQHRDTIQDFLGRLAQNRRIDVAGLLPVFRKHGEPALRFTLRKLLLRAARGAERVVGTFSLSNLLDRSWDAHLLPVVKSVSLVGRVGAILQAAPSTRVLHIVRHPCGVYASLLRGSLREVTDDDAVRRQIERLFEVVASNELPFDKAELPELSHAERLTVRWYLFNKKILSEIADVEGCRWVRYEDLCDDPGGLSRELFELVGLSWSPQTERFITHSTARHDTRYHGVFKDPQRAANAWRSELDSADQERIRRLIGHTDLGQHFF